MRTPDLTGKRFGRLIVIEMEKQRISKNDIHWLCKCDCGKQKFVTTGHLTSGTVKSCGCIKREQAIEKGTIAAKAATKHGMCGSHLYTVWNVMRQRCNNPKNPYYKWYGQKGVKVCEEWNDFSKFEKWATGNGYVYREGVQRNQMLSIDRIDSDGDYCPENCRWITIAENSKLGAKKRWEKWYKSHGSARTSCAV